MELYKIQLITEKRLGAVAEADLPRGTRILWEKPLLTIPHQKEHESDIVRNSQIKLAVASLSKEEQHQFLAQYNHFKGSHIFLGIWKSHAKITDAFEAYFPNICQINHSCNANAWSDWNDTLEGGTIHALRNITKGEEITIDFEADEEVERTSEVRKETIKNLYGFDCDCTLCNLPTPKLRASDERRRELAELHKNIGEFLSKPANHARPEVCVQYFRERAKLMIKERGLHKLLGSLYFQAYQLHLMHGDVARARMFALLRYEVFVTCNGADDPAISIYTEAIKKPTGHRAFDNHFTAWETGANDIPKVIDITDVDNDWLWARCHKVE